LFLESPVLVASRPSLALDVAVDVHVKVLLRLACDRGGWKETDMILYPYL
jgi:hypothetical protein